MTVIHNPTVRPLRVAIITRSLMMGGAQRHIVRLCQSVPRSEVALSLFLLVRDEANDLLPEVPPDIPVFISSYPRHHPFVLPWLARGLRQQQADLAHSFLWTADAYASISRTLFSRVPLICSERGDRAYTKPWMRLFDRLLTFRRASRICANTEAGRRLLQANGCDPAKLEVIYNGVDLDKVDAVKPVSLRKMLGWSDDCLIVGTVSRLIEYKGVEVLIRALAQLQTSLTVCCAIIGDGPQRAELEQLAIDLKVADRVAFLGTRSPSEAFVKDFDIATLTTSQSEACSNSILEYMACGKPVIATEVGGNPELVSQGLSGLLVRPFDSAGLARSLEQLLTHPEQRQQMGRFGRGRIESDFRIDVVQERFVELWRSVATNWGTWHAREVVT